MNLFSRPAWGGGVKQSPSDLALQTKNVTKMHNSWTQAPSYKFWRYINGTGECSWPQLNWPHHSTITKQNSPTETGSLNKNQLTSTELTNWINTNLNKPYQLTFSELTKPNNWTKNMFTLGTWSVFAWGTWVWACWSCGVRSRCQADQKGLP